MYVEAMQRAKISKILAYLMAAGLSLFYKGPTHLVQELVLSKANSCLLSFLIFAKNQRGWINAILKTLDPAGALKLNAQLAENIESMLAWIFSAWMNVSGIMITIDNPDTLNQQNNDKNVPGFFFPSQLASLMLVETEDLIPVIAPIVWPIIDPMMALRYPTQPLRVAASSPTLSILHFVDPQDDARPPGFQTLVRDFAKFRPPMAYTIIKDKKQVEHNFVTLIRARARCAIPTLYLTNAVQRLGGRRKGTTPEKLQYQNIQDTSRMYNPRTRPLDSTAVALTNITCWTNPPIVDQTIYRNYQMLNATIPKIAKEPKRKILPINTEAPSNPKMAMEIFMKLVTNQQEENSSVCTGYLTAIETYKDTSKRYRRQDLANKLPEQCPVGSSTERQAVGQEENSTSGSTTSVLSTITPEDTPQVITAANMDTSTNDTSQANRMSEDNIIVPDNNVTMPPYSPENIPVFISQSEVADIESELNELPSVNPQELLSMDMLPETLNEAPHEQTD